MADNGASPQREISRGMVAIYKEYMGRGPRSAKTIVADDTVITICHGGLTRAEQRLVEGGDAETVRGIRRKFQTAMQLEIERLVQRALGRRPLSFLSDHDVQQDIAIEVVLLEPGDADGDGAASAPNVVEAG